MEKIIFLDFDGVLNSIKTIKDNKDKRTYYYKTLEDSLEKQLRIMLLDIDFEKVDLLKKITDLTDSKIVVTSVWRNLRLYEYVEQYLITCGLPIIGRTNNISNKRGEEIRAYLSNHNVDKYIVLDDEVFDDFDELVEYLVKTDFYNNGLEEKHINEVVNILGLKKPL